MNICRSKAMTWKRREETVTEIWMAINLLERWALLWKTTSNVVIFTLRSADLKFKFNCWFPAQFLSATSRDPAFPSLDTLIRPAHKYWTERLLDRFGHRSLLSWWSATVYFFCFPFFFCNPGIFLFLGRYSASKALLFHWLGNMGRTTGFKTIRFLNKVDAILETKTWNSLFPFYSNPELRKVIVFNL